jgi:hypothetical protein
MLPVGCGKTVLFSTAVEKTREACRADASKQSCFFYCTSRDPSGHDITVLLRLLLIQLCRPPTVSEPLQSLYDLCNEVYPPKIPTTRELANTFQKILENPVPTDKHDSPSSTTDEPEKQRNIYILVDGLDEVPWVDREEFFQLLSMVTALDLHHVHLLVTSRNQPDIQEAMTEPVLWGQITIEQGMVQPDIRRYVSYTIESNRRLSRLPETVKNAIKARVVNQGKGM